MLKKINQNIFLFNIIYNWVRQDKLKLEPVPKFKKILTLKKI